MSSTGRARLGLDPARARDALVTVAKGASHERCRREKKGFVRTEVVRGHSARQTLIMAPDAAPSLTVDLMELLKATRTEDDCLRQEHVALQRTLATRDAEVQQLRSQLADELAAARRAEEVAASQRATLREYASVRVLQHDSHDAMTASEREDAARREAAAEERERRLETHNAALEAELKVLSAQLVQAETRCRRATELEAERDAERAAARRAEHRALEQEALVREHSKRAAASREAYGRMEMQHQRRTEQMQAQLNTITKRLRTEKTLTGQLQARAQEQLANAGVRPTAPAGEADPTTMSRPPPAMFRTAQASAHLDVFGTRRTKPAGAAGGGPASLLL